MTKAREIFYLTSEKVVSAGLQDQPAAIPGSAGTAAIDSAQTATGNGRDNAPYVLGELLREEKPAAFTTAIAERSAPPATALEPEPQTASRAPQASPLRPQPVKAAADEKTHQLNQLAGLIANVTEAYTVAIFLADCRERVLKLAAAHTLSREFISAAEIAFGSGHVGWTAENAVRISVCPFEHDATTLLYYSRDQDLKSFIAVPILDDQKELLGVIACDSKKSYAFAKVTEKILLDCAEQAALCIGLWAKLGDARRVNVGPAPELIDAMLERIREFDDEESMLSFVAKLPEALISRDALVVMTTADAGVGQGAFYSTSMEDQVGHRLLDLVCKHKKIICGERSVHAPPIDDSRQRSFLSVPFHVLGKEAGSLNVLGRPQAAFSAKDIAALERVAKILGRELERIRLRERVLAQTEESPALSWRQFAMKANGWLSETKGRRGALTLIRVAFRCCSELEEAAGIETAVASMSRVLRLVAQVAQPPALVCSIFGPQALILIETGEAERTIIRLRRLLERFEMDSLQPSSKARLGTVFAQGLLIVSATTREGDTLEELSAKTRALLASSPLLNEGKVANVGNW